MISFLSGLAINGGAGFIGGGSVTWSPFAGKYVSHFGFEAGGHIPADAGIAVLYGIFLGTLWR